MQRLDGYSETRPNTHDLLLEFIEMAGGVGSIEIVNYYEGTLMIDIVDETGEVHDAKLTDALVVSEHFGVPITVDQELLNKVSVFVTADDMEAYFGFHFDPPFPRCGRSRKPSAQTALLQEIPRQMPILRR